VHHPLRVSVAHRVHGKAMKTGWTRHPSRLSDRVDADNNTLFETWTSNAGKMDMDEASCIALRDAIKSIQLHRPHLYNPSRSAHPEQPARRSADVEIEGLTSDDVAAQSLIMSVEVDATAVAEGQEEDEVQEGEAGGVQGDEMGAEGEEDE
jgi:hypothetical protein